MGSHQINLLRFFIVFIILSLDFQPLAAARALEGDQWLKKHDVVLQSLPKGNNPPSGPSGCTNVPNNRGGSCPTISSKNFAGAGHVHVEATTVNFRKASTHNAAAQ
ncbi:hypothetical protein NE237_012021 [Protea cynaroides]|uniref:Uncharacterized protein n=1 Tax=Protea cynaroides TaxID=273540 RepID=A0A9Q0GZ15_9MAGN|nr:hypothetical protein NE237_012021 [Protea cynaroides]